MSKDTLTIPVQVNPAAVREEIERRVRPWIHNRFHRITLDVLAKFANQESPGLINPPRVNGITKMFADTCMQSHENFLATFPMAELGDLVTPAEKEFEETLSRLIANTTDRIAKTAASRAVAIHLLNEKDLGS